MSQELIFGPVLAQVALTLWAYALLGVAKSRALKAGRVDLERRALHDDAWPDDVLKVSNNIRNQFQVPVLFYVLALTLWALDAVGWLALAVAWGFVATRVGHFVIHTGKNVVGIRRPVFLAGCVLVLVMLALAVLAIIRT